MGNAESPGPRPAGIPRRLALALAPVVWLVAVPAVHAGIPWALSHLGPRYGWADGEPAGWNLERSASEFASDRRYAARSRAGTRNRPHPMGV